MRSYGCGQKLDSGLRYAALGRRIIPVAPAEAGTQRFPSFPRKREPSGVRGETATIPKTLDPRFRGDDGSVSICFHRRNASRGAIDEAGWLAIGWLATRPLLPAYQIDVSRVAADVDS